jgi:hypothetical protein
MSTRADRRAARLRRSYERVCRCLGEVLQAHAQALRGIDREDSAFCLTLVQGGVAITELGRAPEAGASGARAP